MSRRREEAEVRSVQLRTRITPQTLSRLHDIRTPHETSSDTIRRLINSEWEATHGQRDPGDTGQPDRNL